MDYLIYILAICISAPIFLMMIIADNKARRLLGFMVCGIGIDIVASEINAIMRDTVFPYLDLFHLTTSITPICEEILKALPLLYVAIFITDKRSILFTQAMSIGIGFAVMENTYVLLQNVETVSILWAIARGFSSGLMHSVCTLFVGIGISMIKKRRKLFLTGTFALLVAASIYHSLFNMLIQSNFMYVGALLPILTYLILAYAIYKQQKKSKGEAKI